MTIRVPKSTCLPHEKKSLMSPRKTFFMGKQDVAARRVRQEQINQNLYQIWQLQYTHSARIWKNCRLKVKRIFLKIVIGNLSQQDKTSQVVEAVSIKCRLECVLHWPGIESTARRPENKIKQTKSLKLQGIENTPMLLAETPKQSVPSDVHASELWRGHEPKLLSCDFYFQPAF